MTTITKKWQIVINSHGDEQVLPFGPYERKEDAAKKLSEISSAIMHQPDGILTIEDKGIDAKAFLIRNISSICIVSVACYGE